MIGTNQSLRFPRSTCGPRSRPSHAPCDCRRWGFRHRRFIRRTREAASLHTVDRERSNERGGDTEIDGKKMAKHKCLTGGVKFVDAVPKSPVGKIQRKVMREWAKTDTQGGRAKL